LSEEWGTSCHCNQQRTDSKFRQEFHALTRGHLGLKTQVNQDPETD
jgi:hypothetical protein